MINLSVQINLVPEDFSIIDRDDFIKITLPEIPRIGDQLMLKKVMEAIESWKADLAKKYPSEILPADNTFTYVTNIVYGDNDVIYMGLSYNPEAVMCYIYDYEINEKTYWAVLSKVPKAGDRISFSQDFPHEIKSRYIHDIQWSTGTPDCIVYTRENRPVPIVDINEVNSDINTKVVNTVSTDTYINNNRLDVEVVNPVELESRSTIDVNVKKFDYGYIYVKNESDRY